MGAELTTVPMTMGQLAATINESAIMKFLVVDDDLEMARFIAAVLKIEGIASDIADSAETARSLFVSNDYDALVVDAILPGESGVSLVKGLRESSPGVPVLFCSGATDEFNKKLMWSLGIVCHKPLGESFSAIVRQFAHSFVPR